MDISLACILLCCVKHEDDRDSGVMNDLLIALLEEASPLAVEGSNARG